MPNLAKRVQALAVSVLQICEDQWASNWSQQLEYSIRRAAVACGVSISTMNRCAKDADGGDHRAASALSVSSDEGNESDNPQCETRAMKPLNPDGFAMNCIR